MLIVFAHAGLPPAPHDLLAAWEPDLVVAATLLVVWAVHRHGSRTSGFDLRRRSRLFNGGLAVIALALLTPLDTMSSALASAHMVQHLLLVLVAAPLLAWSRPMPTLMRAVPLGLQRAGWRAARKLRLARPGWGGRIPPFVIWLAYVATLWMWHGAGPYQAALRLESVHAAQHLTFLATGVMFWWFVIGAGRRVPSEGTRILFVFAAAMQGVLLSALLTFAASPWYSHYLEYTAAWGLDPLTDQQLAGLLMWIPSGVLYTVVALVLLGAWLRQPGDRPGRIRTG